MPFTQRLENIILKTHSRYTFLDIHMLVLLAFVIHISLAFNSQLKLEIFPLSQSLCFILIYFAISGKPGWCWRVVHMYS